MNQLLASCGIGSGDGPRGFRKAVSDARSYQIVADEIADYCAKGAAGAVLSAPYGRPDGIVAGSNDAKADGFSDLVATFAPCFRPLTDKGLRLISHRAVIIDAGTDADQLRPELDARCGVSFDAIELVRHSATWNQRLARLRKAGIKEFVGEPLSFWSMAGGWVSPGGLDSMLVSVPPAAESIWDEAHNNRLAHLYSRPVVDDAILSGQLRRLGKGLIVEIVTDDKSRRLRLIDQAIKWGGCSVATSLFDLTESEIRERAEALVGGQP